MTTLQTVTRPGGLVKAAIEWVQLRRKAQSRPGRLRVAELVSLGDKRLVAVVELDGRQFLVGCGPSTVTLLAQLEVPNAVPNAIPDARIESSTANAEFSGVLMQALSAHAAAG